MVKERGGIPHYGRGRSMNLIDAIKSGKRFRRTQFKEWMSGPNGRLGFSHGLMLGKKETVENEFYYLAEQDILADDWEIEEKKVEITRARLGDAIKALYGRTSWYSPGYFEQVYSIMTEELGLE